MASHPILKPNLWALGAVFLVVIQVKELTHVHAYSRSHDHGQSPEDTPKSSNYRFYDQRGGAGWRRMPSGASFVESAFRQSYQRRSRTPLAKTTEHRRRGAAVTFSNARRSRQQMDALMSFRANISNSGTTFRNWDANDSTPCRWTGVSCSHDEQHVLALSLPSRSLEGSINSALVALSKLHSLRTLDLSDNNFTSFISGFSLLNFSRLAFLNLSYNQVSGDIPGEIGEAFRLQWLILAGNLISGPIPPSITNCTMLKTLDLESNFLVSHIPEGIGRLRQLEELVLGTYIPSRFWSSIPVPTNQILGPLPSSLGNCSSLSVLNITNCPTLQGHIPQELSRLHKLRLLRLPICNLKGTLPQWIGNLTNLVEVSLPYNQLQGSIPAELGRLPKLSRLELEHNFFVG